MTTKELAEKLLEYPVMTVMIRDSTGVTIEVDEALPARLHNDDFEGTIVVDECELQNDEDFENYQIPKDSDRVIVIP